MRFPIFVFLAILVGTLRAANYYALPSSAGSGNGSSFANAAAWPLTQASLNGPDVVFVGSGTYTGAYNISKGGTSTSNRITYVGVDTGSGVPLFTGGVNPTTYDYIGWINFEMTGAGIVSNDSFTGWLVKDNYIHDTTGAGFTGGNNDDCSNHTVEGNTFAEIGYPAGANITFVISLYGSNNVIQYNTFLKRSADRVRLFGSENVYRNNYLGPMLDADIPGADPHIDDFQSYDPTNAAFATDGLLMESNFSNQNNSGDAHWFISRNQTPASWTFRWFIARNNISYKNGAPFFLFEEFDDARLGNNTFYGAGVNSNDGYAGTASLGTNPNHTWINNSISHRTISSSSSATLLYSAGSTGTLVSEYNQEYLSGVMNGSNNLDNTEPQFTDPTDSGLNFIPDGDSPLLNAARALTLANGAGTGSATLIVDDALWFTDGWGIVEADVITIGAAEPVAISSINYGTNTITLAATRTWADNATVNLRGTGDDIGAMPGTAGLAPSISSGVVTDLSGSATVTVGAALNVRFVEVLVDNRPVGTSYTPSGNVFTVTWSGDGSSNHVFTARAYAYFPSITPTVETTITTASGTTSATQSRNPAALGIGVNF